MTPRKRFGQHFLEPAWIAKLVDAIHPKPADLFIEIGPGRGAITVPLAARAKHVWGIEIDRDLVAELRQRGLPNLTVIAADVLSVDLASVGHDAAFEAGRAGARRVVGNLPYNISSPVLFRLLEAAAHGKALGDATLMLQKEVVDRLVARPGNGDYGVLSLTTALGADVTRLLSLPPGAFRPVPRVESAVVRLDFRPPPPFVTDPPAFVSLVRSLFVHRRKTLRNALSESATARGLDARLVLDAASIDPRRRPETLDVSDVARLVDALGARPRRERRAP
jgi:16S rRNA (adenine1518-N6/adenine1519-N6)-dimethyltransferase